MKNEYKRDLDSKTGRGQKRTGRIVAGVAVEDAGGVPMVFVEQRSEGVDDEGSV